MLLKNRSHDPRQILLGVRFAQDRPRLLPGCGPGYLLGKTGRQDDGQLRTVLSHPSSKIYSRHSAGHHDVREYDIDSKAVLEGLFGLGSRYAFNDLISETLETLHCQSSNIAVVFDDEHAFAFGGERVRRRSCLLGAFRVAAPWQIEIDRRSGAELAVDRDVAVRLLDETVDGAETQARFHGPAPLS